MPSCRGRREPIKQPLARGLGVCTWALSGSSNAAWSARCRGGAGPEWARSRLLDELIPAPLGRKEPNTREADSSELLTACSRSLNLWDQQTGSVLGYALDNHKHSSVAN